jgi:hypothetical protein
MSDLILGPIVFADFEVPGRIVFGGRQRQAVHQLPGGLRVIDTMGRDDAPIAWRGIFSGPLAAARAQALDLLRAQGAPWTLSWDTFSYLVIISEFTAVYQRQNWVPYRIVCSVVANSTAVLAEAAISVVQGMVGDLTTAGTIAGLDLSGALAAVAAPSALAVGSASYAAAGASLQSAVTGISASLTTAGTNLTAATDFPAAASAAQQCAQLAAAQGYVQRAQANLAAGGS